MPSGLQLFSPAGDLYYDSNMRLARWFATYRVFLANGQSFQGFVDGMINDGTWGVRVYAVYNTAFNPAPSGECQSYISGFQLDINIGNFVVTNNTGFIGSILYKIVVVKI